MSIKGVILLSVIGDNFHVEKGSTRLNRRGRKFAVSICKANNAVLVGLWIFLTIIAFLTISFAWWMTIRSSGIFMFPYTFTSLEYGLWIFRNPVEICIFIVSLQIRNSPSLKSCADLHSKYCNYVAIILGATISNSCQVSDDKAIRMKKAFTTSIPPSRPIS